MDLTKLKQELDRAKIALFNNDKAVFFSSLLMSLPIVWDENQPTAYTNGKKIGFNPDFFMKLKDKDSRVFVLLHEALHVIYDHIGRQPGKDVKVWQAATDYSINWTLVDAGFIFPKHVGGLYDDRFANMGAYDIYNILMAEKFEPPEDMMEDLRPIEGDPVEHQAEVEEMLIRACTMAKQSPQGAGNIPNGFSIMMDKLLNPKLPWNEILSRWLTAKAKNGYNWMKPNKRFFPKHHLPSRTTKGLKKIAVAIDASSSVADFQFNIMVSELGGVLRQFKPDELDLIVFNTEIVSQHRVRSVHELTRIDFKGRGGTCCECVFNWIEDHKPDAVLIFTDGEFYFERNTVPGDIVWIINDNNHFTAPFGKVINYNTY